MKYKPVIIPSVPNCTQHMFDCLVGEEGKIVECMRCHKGVLIK